VRPLSVRVKSMYQLLEFITTIIISELGFMKAVAYKLDDLNVNVAPTLTLPGGRYLKNNK
jgi:hypothetical protein